MPADRLTRKALAVGRAEAREVLRLRATALRRRAAATRALPPRARVRAAGPPGTAGVLLAEGDSWFDYKGDRVEDMAYGRGQLEELTRRLEKLIRDGRVPKAVLLSGGENDKRWWANELHPTARGFARVTAPFANALAGM